MMGESNNSENQVRVLVIEDDPLDSDLLMRQLRKSGMDTQVRFISDGRVALDLFSSPTAPTLALDLIAIFLDLKLPSLGGIELLRRLRGYESFKDIPVIVMTSSNNPDDIAECGRLKVTSYVSKPVTVTSFAKAVADVFHLPKVAEPGTGSE